MGPARLFVTVHATTVAAARRIRTPYRDTLSRPRRVGSGDEVERVPSWRPVRRAAGAQRHGEFIAVSSAAQALVRARKDWKGRGRTCQAMFLHASSIDGREVPGASRADRLDLDDGLGGRMLQSGICSAGHLFAAAPGAPAALAGATWRAARQVSQGWPASCLQLAPMVGVVRHRPETRPALRALNPLRLSASRCRPDCRRPDADAARRHRPPHALQACRRDRP